ncbi:hypothetical protein [Paraflavitalea speifideaquila]|uniref:hypothetical protein n=1 Tax=Paraflavitalea speifideaquila TaxID=3076558 RepID=UPI0033130614
MRLSDLLRYQLYDSARNKVLLSSDIHFLSDFLNLEKIRRDNFDFTVYSQGDTDSIMIPPFLFTTFVENAVKHNMDAHKASFVHVTFKVEQSTLYFSCINSKPALPVKHGLNGGWGWPMPKEGWPCCIRKNISWTSRTKLICIRFI